MSGAKGGTVSILPMVLFGAIGAAATVVVGGVVMGVVSTVNAWRSARDRVEREREQATSEQKAELSKVLQAWQVRLASSGAAVDETATTVKTTEEILAGMVTNHSVSTGHKDGDLLAALRDEPLVQTASVRVIARADKNDNDLNKLIDNVRELLVKVDTKLPVEIMNSVVTLYRETDFNRAAEMVLKIRMGIGRELDQIAEVRQKEMKEARNLLDGLPPNFPPEARAILIEAAEGHVRFDQEARKSVEEMIQTICKQAAAQAMHKIFTDLGYDIEPIGNSLFTEGGDVYFRQSEWEDGYCVKVVAKGDSVKFLMQKTAETGSEYDKDMEQEWKDKFPEVKQRFSTLGIQLNVEERRAPGKEAVPVGKEIRINTGKKRTKKSEQTTGSSTGDTNVTEAKARREMES